MTVANRQSPLPPVKREKVVEMLKRAGLNPSSQRVTLLSLLLKENYHPTPEELEVEANKIEHVSTTTVYLSLRSFLLAGLVHSFLDRGGKIRYGGYPKPHSHALCVVCGTIEDVPKEAEPTLPPGWSPSPPSPLVLSYGLCPTCRKLAEK